MGILSSLIGSVTGNGLLGAATSLVGNVFGAASQSSANKANREINQMNNEFNERMMQKQMDYNTMMWNKQNAYNNPLAQRQRLEAAGMNPYMMMNGGSAGNATGTGSTSMASAAGSAPQQAFLPDFSGIPQSILMAKQGANIDADTKGKVIDNSSRDFRNMKEIANIIADTESKKIANKLSRVQYSYADEMQMVQLANQKVTLNNLLRDGFMMDKELAIFDERSRLEISQRVADILLTNAQVKKTQQETIHEVQKVIKTIAEATGIKLNNNNLASMSGSLVEKARADASRASQPQNIWQGFSDFMQGFDKFVNNEIVKPTKKALKDTRRSFGL